MISTIRIRGNSSSISDSISEESKEIEKKGRTAIIKNFEDGTSIDELEEKFREFGLVNKVTLMCDKLTGKPKSMAYIEFEEQNSRNNSLTLNGTFYKNNIIYVNKQNREIPITAGKKGKIILLYNIIEKCFNSNMDNFFEGAKSNFGPIRMRKKMRKKVEPY